MIPNTRPVLASMMGPLACLAWIGAAHAQAPFSVQEIPVPHRNVAAEIADLDGDGRGDLFTVMVRGMPPGESRTLRVHYGNDAGLPSRPSLETALPPGAGAYDLGDLDGKPGQELVFLHGSGLTVLSLAGRTPALRQIAAPTALTAAVRADERGLDRLRILRPGIAGGIGLLVPGLGEAAVLDRTGGLRGMPRIGGRANYFIPPRPGFLLGENELELYYDLPRLDVGDVDGDQRPDLLASTRHTLRVFLQKPDGSFTRDPQRELAMGLLSQEDHIRASGSARVAGGELNGDGRMDLLVTHTSGGLIAARTRSRIHLNRGGSWNLAEPDQVFENDRGVVTDQLSDLDGDGRDEIIRVFIPLGPLEIAEILLQRALDAEASIHRVDAEGRFGEKPWFKRKYGVAVDFETMRPRGFIPTLGADLNGDGFRDLLSSGNGETLEVYLGAAATGYGTRHGRQEMATGGRLRFGDLNGDGLTDWILYSPRRPGSPVRVGINRGSLPGSPPRLSATD